MKTESLYPALVSAGDVVLDIGANIGQTARMLSPLVGPHGRCLSFEPEPAVFGRLAALAAESQYSNVEPYCCALSDEIGHALLFFGRRPDVAQASTIVKDLANVNRLGRQVGAVKIETDTVDRFCTTRSIAPAFMKIDVEGAEDRVLKGAEKVLSTHQPPLVFEFGYGLEGGTMPGHFTFLERLDYRFFIVDIMFHQGRQAELAASDACLIEISPGQIAAYQLSGNLLAIPVSQIVRIAAIPKTQFDSVKEGLRIHTPSRAAVAGSMLRNAEHEILGAVEKTYREGRSRSISGLRRLARYLGSK